MGCKDPHKMAGIWIEMIPILTLPVTSNPANQNVRGLLTWGGLVVFTDFTYMVELHSIMLYLICGMSAGRRLISNVNIEKWTNCFKGRRKRQTILVWNINRTNFSARFSFCHHQTVSAFDLNIFSYVWILNHLIASDLQSFLFSLKNVHPCETEHRKCPLF